MSRIVEVERAYAQAIGAERAVVFAYARHGILAALQAMNLSPGAEVVLSPLTCRVVPLSLIAAGVKPVFADIEADTLNLDAHAVAGATGTNTAAVLFQHTYGHAGGLLAVADQAGLTGVPVLEDCAQCLPARDRRNVDVVPGVLASVFSNNLRKPLPVGGGAIVVTDAPDFAERVRSHRDTMSEAGWGAVLRLSAERVLHSLILRSRTYWPLYALQQHLEHASEEEPLEDEVTSEVLHVPGMPHRDMLRSAMSGVGGLDRWVEHRRGVCLAYEKALQDIDGIRTPHRGANEPLLYFAVITDLKPDLLALARRRRVEIIAWPETVPIFPLKNPKHLARYGYELGSCPVAESVASTLVGLPTDLNTGTTQIARVSGLLAELHRAGG